MKFKYKPNYFIATLWWSIEFDDKWEFDTKTKSEETIMEEIGAVKVIAKKTTKK